MDRPKDIEGIIRSHTFWAMGAGLIPIPLVDFAAITGVQMDLLKQLAKKYGVDFDSSSGKALVSALTGSTLAALGASLFKAIPVVGTILGGLSLSAFAGASTYAVGQVTAAHFESDGTLSDFDLETARDAYDKAFKKGKEVVSEMEDDKDTAREIFESLEKLGKLRDSGVLTEDEFEAKKAELLGRL